MSNILVLNNAVKKNINEMVKGCVFQVDLDKDALWETYLSSFPEGTNPLYKERTEHDCNCCKQFVKGIGSMVTIENGVLKSVWDIDINDDTFQVVADALSEFVKGHEIKGVYRHFQNNVGVASNVQELESGDVIRWDHLNAKLPNSVVLNKGQSLGDVNSHVVANHDVLERSLNDINEEAIEIVLDLIDQNSLYRGEEHKGTVKKLLEVKREYDKASHKKLFVWDKSVKLGPVSRFKNTVIGTLLSDISDGVDLEKAVKSFEAKVAPANYKRPKALITQKMIDNAQKSVKDIGLSDSLERRYAKPDDISVNNVLFADRSAKKVMKDVFDELKPTAKSSSKSFDKVEEVSIEHFVEKILPKAESLEVLVENKHVSNLFSLIAPEYDAAESLFKWDNGFSWTYNGEVADSDIRNSVQSRGGRVDGVFRFSHMWNYDERNVSLMDLHVFMPGSNMNKKTSTIDDRYGNNERVGWNNRKHIRSGGVQDVDHVAEAAPDFVPVENITFPDIDRMPEGEYVCMIHNWNLRQPTKGGFKAEIEFNGNLYEYEVKRPLKHKEWIKVATVTLKDKQFSIEHHLPCGSQSREVWNISTENFQKVNMVMFSPNHWDDLEIGNKHYFFVLDECKNPENARGFYNEFLRGDLTEHRKVFEVLASKMKCDYTDNQLSGIGFSSTVKNEFICKVSGSFNRTLKVKV